jgi:hypothetical protein
MPHFLADDNRRQSGPRRIRLQTFSVATRNDLLNIPDRPSELAPYADKLSHMLRQEAGKSRKQKQTAKQLHAYLAALGYDGSYNRVAALAREWKAARQREQKTAGRGVFAPLAFMARPQPRLPCTGRGAAARHLR